MDRNDDQSRWLNLEINGRPVRMPPGSTVMDAASQLKVFIPHFCYHKKLSIAANCRMCLVQIDKIPKPVPACATTVSEGMKVWTRSEMALKAQQSVMEFLLINHPLDCPICDQGGECLLQDLAVGYGKGHSQFHEAKRVVPGKELGPLVSAAEMSRCIQCTRCVRFGEEVAGRMELGMVQRGDRSEIVPFVGETVESELSGNMIDLCPVGALTSKPFRYQARTWELARRRSVSPHDAHGANLIVQIKRDRVMRVVPFDNEAVNECWLSDKDRFSYEALNCTERLTRPLVKKDGALIEADWQEALPLAAARLQNIIEREGAETLGVLVSPHATLEEATLTVRLFRALGCKNIDSRLRRYDFLDDTADGASKEADGSNAGIPWLGMPIAAVSHLRAALVIGSFLRNDHPLLAVRLRQAAKHGAKISSLHSTRVDGQLPLSHEIIVAPSQLAATLAMLVAAAHRETGKALPQTLQGVEPSEEATALVRDLIAQAETQQAAVFLGSFAQQHRQAALLQAMAQVLAECTGATFGILPEAANSIGVALADAAPDAGGLNARTMLETPRRAYVLLHAEPPFDTAQGAVAQQAMRQADFVLSLSPFRPIGKESDVEALPDIILPIAPFTETSGTFVNMEGRLQSFHGVAPPLGETRPGWQVIAALAELLGKPFAPSLAETTPEMVRDLCVPSPEAVAARLSNHRAAIDWSGDFSISIAEADKDEKKRHEAPALERVAAVPIYAADPLVRRAASLQSTTLAAPPRLLLNAATASQLKLTADVLARVRQGEASSASLAWAVDDALPPQTFRLDMAHPLTAALDRHGAFAVEAVATSENGQEVDP